MGMKGLFILGAFLALFSFTATAQQHPNRVVAYPPDVDSIYALLSDTTDGGRGMWANRDFVIDWLDIQAGLVGLGTWNYRTTTTPPVVNARIHFNNANPLLADSMYVSKFNAEGSNVAILLQLLDGEVWIPTTSDPENNYFLVKVVYNNTQANYVAFSVAAEVFGTIPSNTNVKIITAGGGGPSAPSNQTLFYPPRERDSVVVDTVNWAKGGTGRVIEVGNYANGDPDTLTFLMGDAVFQSNEIHFFRNTTSSSKNRLALRSYSNNYEFEVTRDLFSPYPSSGGLLSIGSNSRWEASNYIALTGYDGANVWQTEDGGSISLNIKDLVNGEIGELSLTEYGGTEVGITATSQDPSGGAPYGLYVGPSSFFNKFGYIGQNTSFTTDTVNYVKAGEGGVMLNSTDGYYFSDPVLAGTFFSGNVNLPDTDNTLDSVIAVNNITGEWKLKSIGDAIDAKAPQDSKNFGLFDITATDDVAWFYTTQAITITQVNDMVTGGGSFDYNIVFAATANDATPTKVWTLDRTNNSASGGSTTTFDDATIPADRWVRIKMSAQSGTTDFGNITIHFTYD